ncbi:hypothetical protein Q5P01_020978 [Channa striata]|uniref:Uncharacterized protein n=1 Tax=Channa striata TaxID=64152 RepID=A0AA88S4E3_CHASR|nr:hypothetical protein Q5P01_020978 [Channa striata]
MGPKTSSSSDVQQRAPHARLCRPVRAARGPAPLPLTLSPGASSAGTVRPLTAPTPRRFPAASEEPPQIPVQPDGTEPEPEPGKVKSPTARDRYRYQQNLTPALAPCPVISSRAISSHAQFQIWKFAGCQHSAQEARSQAD